MVLIEKPQVRRHSARRARAALLALAMSAGFVSLNTGSASALSPGDLISSNLLRNWETGLCLESYSAGSIRTGRCQVGNTNQTWKIFYFTHGTHDEVYIQNAGTRRCLADPDGRLLVDFDCVNNGKPTFEGIGSSWDKVQLKSTSRGACLDSNRNGDAYMNSCNGGGYQLWKSGF
ncbi:RICIN domain-containing protein [Streptomyces niveiscabiei]|uniref:RICIN domain-containing protein n=1 Tax=Streptomyces niveiscabiei TaxID=164115 RepID=A0ABW9HR94_9ACTN